MDIDLDAYADDEDASAPDDAQPAERPVEQRASVLEAAERAGMPLDELLPKLDR
jgi:hypothetical protein